LNFNIDQFNGVYVIPETKLAVEVGGRVSCELQEKSKKFAE